jgi:hypothetical protein
MKTDGIRQSSHTGKQCAHLNIGCHVTPGIRIVLKAGVNLPADFAEAIRAKIVALVDAEVDAIAEEFAWSSDDEIDVRAEQYELRPFREVLDRIRPDPEQIARAKAAHDAALDGDPNNGTYGLWVVSGVRHEATIDATTAREAYDRAIADGEVGEWEAPTVMFKKALAVSP